MATRRRVGPELYDSNYLLSENTEGFCEFLEGSLSFVKQHQLELLELGPGISLLEVGFGRGEFLRHCAARGARVSGIDYSPAALEIARRTLSEYPQCDLRVADCRELPFEADSFDRVYAGDVIEHQDLEDGVQMLREMYRVLGPGGLLFVHTAPNTVFTRLVLPLAKPLLRRIDRASIETLEEHMRVNETVHLHEFNPFSLRRIARMAELPDPQVWVGEDVLRSARHRHTETLSRNRLVRLVAALGRIPPLRFLLGNDLYLRCRKPR